MGTMALGTITKVPALTLFHGTIIFSSVPFPIITAKNIAFDLKLEVPSSSLLYLQYAF
jgi:hypothetical protein